MIVMARASNNCKRQTHPLDRECGPHQQIRNCLTAIKIWSWAPDGCLTPTQTGRLAIGRNVTLAVTEIQTKFKHTFSKICLNGHSKLQ
jgi:hypothetical protein